MFKEENTNIRLYRLVYFNGNNQLIVSDLENEDDAKIDEISNFVLNKLRKLKKHIQQLSESYYRVARVAISDIAYLFKSLDYAYENEFRILMKIDKSLEDNIQIDINNDQYLLHAYTLDKQQQKIPIKYSTVILGPKSEDIDYIAPYIKLCDRGIKVKRSNIKYR